MIKYTLTCKDGHSFDSWFASADAFEGVARAGHLACAVCGGGEVRKSLMAPQVATSEKGTALRQPESEMEKAVAQMRDHVEANSDYVGKDFVSQARAMHDGDAPERAIHGEARLDQAKKLVEDGVPVVPLPFAPKQKLS